jgi:hypothetical protein
MPIDSETIIDSTIADAPKLPAKAADMPAEKPARKTSSAAGKTRGAKLPPASKRRRLKRIRISEALRHEGLDERAVAQKLNTVIERQMPKEDGEESDDKFLVDMLMDCFRYLDDPPRPGGGKAPLAAKLVHDIPRPQRAGKTKEEKQKGNQK